MKRIPADEAKALANEVFRHVGSIEGVYINNLQSSAHHPPLNGPFDLENGISLAATQEGGRVVSRARYEISASTEDGVAAWNVNVDVVAAWVLAEDAPELSHEALQCFALGMGVTTCHPYAREVVQGVTGKLGYPPAVLDVIVSPLSTDREIEITERPPREAVIP